MLQFQGLFPRRVRMEAAWEETLALLCSSSFTSPSWMWLESSSAFIAPKEPVERRSCDLRVAGVLRLSFELDCVMEPLLA